MPWCAPLLYRLFGHCVAAILAFGASAALAELQVYPLRINFEQGDRTATLKVINMRDAAVRLQASTRDWTQTPSGPDVEMLTTDLLIFPRIVDVPGGREQVFRLGYRGRPSQLERAFRILIEEIPSEVREPGLHLTLALSLPAFVAPAGATGRRDLSVTSAEVTGSELIVTFVNRGDAFELPTALTATLLASGGRVLANLEGRVWYVLAGAEKSYSVKLPPAQCRAAARATYRVELGKGRAALEGSVELQDKSACRAR